MRDYTQMVLIVGAVLVAGAATTWAAVYAVQAYVQIGTMMNH